MRLLLDTCSFLWLSQQPDMLSGRSREAVDRAIGPIFLSDASIWEITLKYSRGKLPLPNVPRTWIPEKIQYHQLKVLPISHPNLFLSGELKDTHPDPFDRLIAAQAILGDLTIPSPDTALSDLGANRIW